MILKDSLKERIRNEELTIIFESEESVILEANNFGVITLLENYGNVPQVINVYDKLIGKGAAILLTQYNVNKVYAKTITKKALEILSSKYEVEYDRVVDNILNRDRSDLCPIEKIASETDDIDTLIDELTKFYVKIGVFND